MKVGDMVVYGVNDKPENIYPARVTWVNPPDTNVKGSVETCDLLVMVHPEDFPEFSQAECEAGHAHRLEIKQGTEPGTFRTIPAPAAADPRVDDLAAKVSSLATTVGQLTTELAALKN